MTTKAPPKTLPNIMDRNVRTLITPEGIDLRLRLADGGARIGAFLIDIFIMVFSLFIFTWFLGLVWAQMGGPFSSKGDFVEIIWMLGFFFLRNFYFMFFEMGPKAATPGKRLVKTRVAARNGEHLTASAVFARNAIREIEFFIPLSFIFTQGAGGVDGWIQFMGLIWSLIFVMFPLFNKDKLRAGDLIAGTWVVQAPRQKLSKDLAEPPKKQSRFRFSNTQIDAYGVKELHVLETVLRKNHPATLEDVSSRIATKIEWENAHLLEGSPATQREFLSAYYAALRGKLETKLLFGVRRKDKFDKS